MEFGVYIANLGKYNEGKLKGAWFYDFPLNEDVVAETIGLNERYEEYAIHDTDGIAGSLSIEEYMSIDELNTIYDMVKEIVDEKGEDFLEVVLKVDNDIENIYRHYEDIEFYPNCTLEDLAYDMVNEWGCFGEIPESIADYIDYDLLARDLSFYKYQEVSNGVIRWQ